MSGADVEYTFFHANLTCRPFLKTAEFRPLPYINALKNEEIRPVAGRNSAETGRLWETSGGASVVSIFLVLGARYHVRYIMQQKTRFSLLPLQHSKSVTLLVACDITLAVLVPLRLID